MEALKNCILNQVSMENKSIDTILSAFKPLSLKKGEFFLEANKNCNQLAFIESGFLRMFTNTDGKEVTLWIGSTGKFITSLSNFALETPNIWNIQALTHCKLYVINKEKHLSLLQKEPKWLEFDNALLVHSFALLEKSMFSQLHTTAKQRYLLLLKENPKLFLNVPLQHIASMLGITPETLSRLRKEIS